MSEAKTNRRSTYLMIFAFALGGTLILVALFMLMLAAFTAIGLGPLIYGLAFGFLGFVLVGLAWSESLN